MFLQAFFSNVVPLMENNNAGSQLAKNFRFKKLNCFFLESLIIYEPKQNNLLFNECFETGGRSPKERIEFVLKAVHTIDQSDPKRSESERLQSRKMIGMMGSSVLNLRHWILTNSKVITCFFRLSFIDVPVTARGVNDVVLFIGEVSNSFQFCLSQYVRIMVFFVRIMHTSRIFFNAHKTMVSSRGWQWDRNVFSVPNRCSCLIEANSRSVYYYYYIIITRIS